MNNSTNNIAIHDRGFSLIELMITVAIVGILAGIAYPSYTESVKKSKRVAVQSDMLQFANAIERVYTVRGNYSTVAVSNDGSDPNTGDDTDVVYRNYSPSDGDRDDRQYTLAVLPRPNGCVGSECQQFLIVANRQSGSSMEGDKCGNFRMFNTGRRLLNSADSGVTLEDCWKQ